MMSSLSLVFLAVFLTGISQVLLKIGSAHQGKRKKTVLAVYLNFPTFFAYGLLLFVTIISVIALKEIPLKVFYAITSLGFVVVLIFSWGLLGERITKKTVIGVLLIMVGIWVFNLL
jgi:small multidrug resistance pump